METAIIAIMGYARLGCQGKKQRKKNIHGRPRELGASPGIARASRVGKYP